jgi:flagellar basal body-associated protein FliL
MNKLFIFTAAMFTIVVHSIGFSQEAKPITSEKVSHTPASKASLRAQTFAEDMKKTLSLNDQEYRDVLRISMEAANKVEKERLKHQSLELTEQAIRQIRNDKLVQLQTLLGKERMNLWKKHQKSKRIAKNSPTEFLED